MLERIFWLGTNNTSRKALKLSKFSGARESKAHVDSDHAGMRESTALGMNSGMRKSEAPGHSSRSGGKKYQIHPTWSIHTPPRQQWPEPHAWAGVQGHTPKHTFICAQGFFHWERSVLARFHASVRTFRFDPRKAVLQAESSSHSANWESAVDR